MSFEGAMRDEPLARHARDYGAASVSTPTMAIVAAARPAHMAGPNHQGGRLHLSMADPLDPAGPHSMIGGFRLVEKRRDCAAAAV